MSQPDVGDVHVSGLITDVLIGFNPGGFIATELFPVVGIDHRDDLYANYAKSAWARDEGSSAAASGYNGMLRAPGTKASRTGFSVSNSAIHCDNLAIGVALPDELVVNADGVFDLEMDAARLASTLVDLRIERMFVADFFKTSVWGTDQTVTGDFSNYGTSTPIEDLRTAIRTVRRQSLASVGGRIQIAMGPLVWDRLADHPDLLERIKYTRGGVVGPDLLGSLLANSGQYPVDILIGNSVVTVDEEGTAESSVTYSDVWGGNMLVTFRPNSPSKMTPSSGYTFVWRPMMGGGNATKFARRYREEPERQTVVEAHTYIDMVSTLTSTGVFFNAAAT